MTKRISINKNLSPLYSSLVVVLALFIVVGIIWAWTEPSVTPPGGNVYPPLNTSNVGQVKVGGLQLNTGGAATGLIVGEGDIMFGTTLGEAGYRVTIDGGLYMSNTKIGGVSEIDPVFGIGGKKYTTYMPDFIGQKVEVVGVAQLKGDKLEIDLAREPEGSDLWLFWQAVDWESVIPFMSAQDNASLYSYIDGSKFVIRLKEGAEDARFSYRLIGTRLDHADDLDNLYDDQGVSHFIDIDSLRGSK